MRSTTRLTIQWIFFFCFLFSRCCSADTSVHGRHSRWERLDGSVSSSSSAAFSSKKNGSASSIRQRSASVTTSEPNPSITAMASGRKACGLYIWDAPSALLHKWCTHLLRDKIYEGRGGHKVREDLILEYIDIIYVCL
jgi:hypothetical protein